MIRIETEKASDTKLPVAHYEHYSWPHQGKIEFRDYFTKYRPTLPYVLKNVSFQIRDSEKVTKILLLSLTIYRLVL